MALLAPSLRRGFLGAGGALFPLEREEVMKWLTDTKEKEF